MSLFLFCTVRSFLSSCHMTKMFASALQKLCRLLCLQCDEIYPTCSNCKRLNSICSLSASESPTDSEVVEKQLNIEDLQLLHDWHMGSVAKFSDHNAEEAFRQQRGREIDLGFKHPYGGSTSNYIDTPWTTIPPRADHVAVLHIILAIAALHLTTLHPEEPKWYALAISHHGAAIRLARPHITAANPIHVEAIFNFSAFNSLFSFTEPVLRPATSDPCDYLGDLLDSFRMARGIRAIIAKNPELLADQGLTNNPAWAYDTTMIKSKLTETYPQVLELEKLVRRQITDPDQQAATLKSVRNLFINMAVLDDSPKDHSSASLIQRWAIEFDMPFFVLCDARHPIAMIVLAWYALLCQKRANIWFFQRWPEVILHAIEKELQGTEWEPWIVEPKREVERLLAVPVCNEES